MATIDVKLVDVVKRYGEAVVVDHINLEVQAGEFFTLLGPSGCGKTTTLRMIGGFEAPTSGLIELKGEDVTWLPPYKRHVNTVFQNYALFPHLTIYENVAFGLRRTHVDDAEVKSRVTEMLKLVELPGFERRKPTQISGGQAQRVALARALINRPSVLLLDEPLGALDLKLRKQMQVELKRIQQEVGITFIFVTHDQEEAMTMSDRIAVMNHGRYEQLADPASLYERPRTRFVAGFLGVSNLLPTTAQGSEGEFAVSRLADGSTVRVPIALTEGFDAYEIGVRPEKIRMLELHDPVPDGVNQLQGTVRDVSYLGVSTSYIIETRGGGTVAVYEQNVQRATRAELWEPGEEVRLVWSPTHTFAVEAGGEPPPDLPAAAVLAAAAAAAPPPPPGVSRRKFVVGGAIAVVAVGFGAFLASTAGSGIKPAPSSSTAVTPPSKAPVPTPGPSVAAPSAGASASAAASQPIPSLAPATGTLRFANWEGYMDINEATNKYPTLERFTKETGIQVKYVEAIDGNETFFTSNLAGPLGAGLPTEWDLIVMTDWMIARLIRLGWLETLDPMPNFPANLLPIYHARSFDPNTNLAAPLQSGMTGMMLNKKKTGPQESLSVVFSDKFAGKMTYLDEMRDTIGLAALHLGYDPASITQEQFDACAALVEEARVKKWVRQILGNQYTELMIGGGAIIAIGWSGDIALIQNKAKDFAWVLATEGGMLWTDNMAIPKGTPNKLLALHWINFYYDPWNAAIIEAYVNYVCPVKGARELMLEIDPALANNPLIFPPEDWLARLHQFRDTTAQEEFLWAKAFTKAAGL